MRLLIILLLCLTGNTLSAQELFPNSEPASTVPKGVLGIRQVNETYKEVNIYRNLFALRGMYGITPKLTLMVTGSVSNHHDVNFPPNLVFHTHNGSQTIYGTGQFQRGIVYPYKFTGVYMLAKYRVFTSDGENSHFRIALYADWSNVKAAHDESEPNLLDDTKGYGGGFILTALKNRLAVSLTSGGIIPGSYRGFSPDSLGGPLIPTEIKYGKAIKYSLSFGYLFLPFRYKNYKQTNLNLYMELIGKSYQGATVYQYGGLVQVPVQTPLLQSGHYLEVHPAVQFIFNSNLRIDISSGFPLLGKSYTRFYPVYMIALQRYFYFKRKARS